MTKKLNKQQQFQQKTEHYNFHERTEHCQTLAVWDLLQLHSFQKISQHFTVTIITKLKEIGILLQS